MIGIHRFSFFPNGLHSSAQRLGSTTHGLGHVTRIVPSKPSAIELGEHGHLGDRDGDGVVGGVES